MSWMSHLNGDRPKISEEEAWERIAESVDKGWVHGWGLCYHTVQLYDNGHITREVKRRMLRRLTLFYSGSVYYWGTGSESQPPRVLAALLLAAMVSDDLFAQR